MLRFIIVILLAVVTVVLLVCQGSFRFEIPIDAYFPFV